MKCVKTSLVVPLLATAWALNAGAADKPVLRLRATAVDLGGATPEGGSRRAGATALEIGIERFTTDDEHARVAAILAEKGPEALMSALQKLPAAGYIRTSSSLRWDVHYARDIAQSDGSRRIVIATDRPMNFYELWNRPRSVDYQYLLAEIRLGPDGKGRGTLVPAARIDYHEVTKTIEVENYASQPIRLTDVRVEK